MNLVSSPQVSEMMHYRDEDKRSVADKVIEEVEKWMARFDCLVIGPGLGRDPFLLVRNFKEEYFVHKFVELLFTHLQKIYLSTALILEIANKFSFVLGTTLICGRENNEILADKTIADTYYQP